MRPRVWFGERWITSIFDLFEENVRYFPALLPVCDDEDPVEVLDARRRPALAELRLHNGTIYRWNRPIYDVVARHARTCASRTACCPPARPSSTSSPTPPSTTGSCAMLADEERPALVADVVLARPRRTSTPARATGIDARVYWPGLGEVPVAELVLRRLLPLAHEGLDRWGVDAADRDRLLGIIERPLPDAAQRRDVAGRRRSTASTSERGSTARDALREMTVRYRELMHANEPVHDWPLD